MILPFITVEPLLACGCGLNERQVITRDETPPCGFVVGNLHDCMMKTTFALLAALLLAPFAGLVAAEISKPNIVFILADDMGYGDVQCLNPQRGKVATPHLDKLAAQGMTFTDAHSSSSVCTPTRYSILTGRYNWRSRLQSSVLDGYSAPLIAADRLTVPALLRQHGYTTACIGKWHLGMSIPEGEPSPAIPAGPTMRGFDCFFGISASLDMPPFAYIENDRFTEPLTTKKTWLRTGAAAASFEAVDVLPTLAGKSADYIAAQAKTGKPFFLYLPLTSPHTPILPSRAWQGKSSIGKYGDFVMETDWSVGEVMAALEKAGISKNTLVIFTSDNGCSKAAKITEMEAKGHFPARIGADRSRTSSTAATGFLFSCAGRNASRRAAAAINSSARLI